MTPKCFAFMRSNGLPWTISMERPVGTRHIGHWRMAFGR
jgi:hypothetical protein